MYVTHIALKYTVYVIRAESLKVVRVKPTDIILATLAAVTAGD